MTYEEARVDPPAARLVAADRGSSFIEILVSIVLIGLVITAVMTALNVSIRGSDQHKSKIMALAELESAAAHLNRVFANDLSADCAGPTPLPSVFDNELIAAYTSGPLQDPNRGVNVEATNVSCVSGVSLVTLVASHDKGNAVEQLDVTVGGITVLEDGDLGAAGACSWVTATTDNPNPIRKPSGRLDSTVTVTLSYVGDCTTETVNLQVTSVPPYPATSVPMTLNGTTLSGEFQFTFSKNYYSPWFVGNFTMLLTTSTSDTFTPSFTVSP